MRIAGLGVLGLYHDSVSEEIAGTLDLGELAIAVMAVTRSRRVRAVTSLLCSR
jgi:hypothetical protein